MNALGAAARLDVMTVRPYARQLMPLLAVPVLLALTSGSPALLVVAAGAFAAVTATYPFAVGSRNDLGALHEVLPVGARTLVAARYLVLAAWFAVMAAGAGLVAGVMSSVRDGAVDAGSLLAALPAGFAVFVLLTATQVPVYYAMGYVRGRFVAMLPVAVAAGAGGALSTTGDGGTVVVRAAEVLTSGTWSTVVALVAVLVYVASAEASVALDARRRRRDA